MILKGAWDSSDIGFTCLSEEISCKVLRARKDPCSFAERFPSLSKSEYLLGINRKK